MICRALLVMAIVEEGPKMEEEVTKKEDKVFDIQLQLLVIKLRLLEEEECRLKLQEKVAGEEALPAISRQLENIPSKMSKLRLRMVQTRTIIHIYIHMCRHAYIHAHMYTRYSKHVRSIWIILIKEPST